MGILSLGGGGHWEGTLPETNSSPLKMDGWNTILSYWGCLFSGAKMLVSGRVPLKFARGNPA